MDAKIVALFFVIGAVSCSEDSKSLVLNVLLKLRTRTELSDNDLSILKNAQEDDLPEAVKRVVKVISSGAHVCCRSVPVTVVKKSRSSKRVTTHRTNYRAGNSHCGLWGWKRCARYENKYREIVGYVREYYQDKVEAKCPEKDVVCCHMYVNVSGRCVSLPDLSKVSGHLVG